MYVIYYNILDILHGCNILHNTSYILNCIIYILHILYIYIDHFIDALQIYYRYSTGILSKSPLFFRYIIQAKNFFYLDF